MMKKLFVLLLAAAMALTAVSALAEGSVATPSDLYEREENDGHAHFVYCANPHVCYRCGASVTVDSDHIAHQATKYVPYNEMSHRLQCADCGAVQEMFEDDHIAYCDSTGVCRVCGWAGKIGKVDHDYHIVGDAAGHFMTCSRCGQTSTKQAHYASCTAEAGRCERCGEPFSGAAQHFRGTNAARYDAVYHWFKCQLCGEEIQEKHYTQSYYWYEHEDQEAAALLCGGCGIEIKLSAAGTSGKTSSGNDGKVGGSSALLTGGEVTAATLHGNTEGLPMALVYAPRTGKATLREKASADARALRTLKDGTVVTVLEKGHRFTRVRVDGQVGYVLTAALEWIDPNQCPLGESVLICTTASRRGNTTVSGRIEPSAKAAVAEAWPADTVVLVWSVSEDEQWYEVEYEGLRAYVQADCLTVTARYGEEAEEVTEA